MGLSCNVHGALRPRVRLKRAGGPEHVVELHRRVYCGVTDTSPSRQVLTAPSVRLATACNPAGSVKHWLREAPAR